MLLCLRCPSLNQGKCAGSCCLEHSLCVIQRACLTLQWKDTDSSFSSFCDCRSGANHIFQVQLIAVLRTSLLNKAMFIQPTCSILPFLFRISSNNHFTDMVLEERIIYCVNYKKNTSDLKKLSEMHWFATCALFFDWKSNSLNRQEKINNDKKVMRTV